jgi:CBS domain containing-hemolysin-like protein
MEAVLLSVPVSYLQSLSGDKDKGPHPMIKQKEDIDRPLSAILTVNTIAHTVGAAGVGSQATIVFGKAYFGIVSAVLTILILIFTEIIPKTLGANYCKELSTISSRIINGMIFITYPFVWLSSILTKVLARDHGALTTSRDEISALASIGTQEGIFAEKENKIIQNLIKLKSIKVEKVMTPRIVVVTASEDMTMKEFQENKEFLHYSRIPVFKNDKDQITGYILREVVFEKLAEGKPDLKLKAIRRDIVTLPSTMSLFDAWEELLKKKEHISLIVDEYGGMDGITTLEDVIETLLGLEIVDEKDKIVDMQQYAMKRWRERQRKYRGLEE